MNWKYLILLFTYIIITYCEYVDFASEELAALILAAANPDGSIATEIIPENNPKNETRPITIDVSSLGRGGELMNIQQIIPSLRNLEGDKLNKKFKELYDLANRVYNRFIDPAADQVENINGYDVLRYIIFNEDEKTGAFDSIGLCNNDVKTRIMFVPNDSAITMMKHFIANADYDDFYDIDINNFDKLNKKIKSSWKSDHFNLPSEELSKVLTIKCIQTYACKFNFMFEDKSEEEINNQINNISFNIIETTDKNNNKYYSLLINKDIEYQIIYAFTIKYDGNKYSTDERFPARLVDYNEIGKTVEQYHMNHNEESNEIERDGINLIAACGIDFVVGKGNDKQYLLPEDYISKDDNEIKMDSVKDILITANFANNKDFKTFNKNGKNLICDRYDISYATTKMETKRFIEKRLNYRETDSLSDNQLMDLNALFQIMALKDLFIDPMEHFINGMLHYTNTPEYLSQISDFEESRYLAAYTQTKLNKRLGSKSKGLKNFAAPITSYDLKGATLKADEILKNNSNEFSKRNLPSFELVKRDSESEQKKLIKQWMDIVDTYEDIIKSADMNFMEDSKTFLASFYEVLLEFNNRQIYDIVDEIKSKKDNNNNDDMFADEDPFKVAKSNIQNILLLENYFQICLRSHLEKYGMETLLDENGRYLFRNLPDIGVEASKNINVLNNLYETTLEDIFDLIDDALASTDMDNSLRYGNTVDTLSTTKRSEQSEYLEIDGDYIADEIEVIEHKDLPIKDRLRNLLIDVNSIITSIEIHNNDENEPINGSETFDSINGALIRKYKEAYPDDKEIQGMINDEVENENENESSSKANLKLKRILSNVEDNDLNEYIVNNVDSKYYLKRIFSRMRLEITANAKKNAMYDGTEEDDDYVMGNIDLEIIKKLNVLCDKIYKKLDNYLKKTNPEGNEEEGEHLLELISNYNDLMSYIYSEQIINENYFVDFVDSSDITEIMNYIFLKDLINAINKTIKSNPELFKNGITDFNDEIDKSGNKKSYQFGTKVLYEPTVDDYKRILVDDENIEYETDALQLIISKIKPEQYVDFEKAIALKKSIIKCQPPSFRIQDEIEDYEYLYGEILKNINSKIVSTKLIESDENSLYRNFYNFIRVAAEVDDHINIDNMDNDDEGELNFSTLYRDDDGKPIENNSDALFAKLEVTFTDVMDSMVQGAIENGYVEEDKDGNYIYLDNNEIINLRKRNLNKLSKNFSRTNSTFNLKKRKIIDKRAELDFEKEVAKAVEATKSLDYAHRFAKGHTSSNFRNVSYSNQNQYSQSGTVTTRITGGVNRIYTVRVTDVKKTGVLSHVVTKSTLYMKDGKVLRRTDRVTKYNKRLNGVKATRLSTNVRERGRTYSRQKSGKGKLSKLKKMFSSKKNTRK
ncbi:hypothetical protein BCR32DRAFT_240886 [Anaeromyces robustus]|uniref:Uncharacterized protein n=1 Tax=Anaeromyces robustus TaxID=1754192 RepID=A0A1Y1XLJ3_9FUNG|nr:hypothetical protein BCR32DRAFT_240886 [Anaeromyces robustus]|eukprot:ORX86620.1 hypothetical protein BCR32DRAFT_240886 [Anaeromyces robustus]